jgi:sarcosine oxidase subunit gamma
VPTWIKSTGIALPAERLRALTSQNVSALWLGPDEWLVLMPSREADQFRGRLASLNGDTGYLGSIVEVSARNVAIALNGARVRWILQAGCPLDLSDAAFPAGSCTRTLFGKAEIVLWRRYQDVWHLDCWRSFAPYLWSYLAQTAAESASTTP